MTATRYFHGGYGKLAVGDMVLPPSETRAASNAEYGASHVCRRDRVYVTSNPDAAFMWAALSPCGSGAIYEVVPLGGLAADPDCSEPGLSFECERARVVRIVHRCTKFDALRMVALLGGRQ
jgi:hypothetical protein